MPPSALCDFTPCRRAGWGSGKRLLAHHPYLFPILEFGRVLKIFIVFVGTLVHSLSSPALTVMTSMSFHMGVFGEHHSSPPTRSPYDTSDIRWYLTWLTQLWSLHCLWVHMSVPPLRPPIFSPWWCSLLNSCSKWVGFHSLSSSVRMSITSYLVSILLYSTIFLFNYWKKETQKQRHNTHITYWIQFY